MIIFGKDKNLLAPVSDERGSDGGGFSLDSASGVNILACSREKTSLLLLKSLTSFLSHHSLNVRVLCEGKDGCIASPTPGVSYSFYSRKDFSYFGKPKSSTLQEFISSASDIFIDLTISPSKRAIKIMRRVNPRISIAINPTHKASFDFCYTIPDEKLDSQDIFSPMWQYLGLIKR